MSWQILETRQSEGRVFVTVDANLRVARADDTIIGFANGEDPPEILVHGPALPGYDFPVSEDI